MKNINIQYKELLFNILENGYEYTDSKRDVKCKQIDDAHIHINLQEGFPAISLKKLWWHGVVGELLWFLSGNTNIKYLLDNGINIWNKDAYNYFLRNNPTLQVHRSNTKSETILFEKDNEKHFNLFLGQSKLDSSIGNLGRVYGAQWRNWDGPQRALEGLEGIDQISNLITNLKKQPMSRRHIVTAWNPAELDDMALPPCHWSFEVIVRPLHLTQRLKYVNVEDFKKKLSKALENNTHKGAKKFREEYCDKYNIPKYVFTLKWHQRSVDTYLGLPFNIASYALLAHIIGKLTNMVPMNLIGDLSNVHLYENSWEAARKLLKRDPMKYALPKLGMTENVHNFNSKLTLDELLNAWSINDFALSNYQSYDNIPVEMLAPNG